MANNYYFEDISTTFKFGKYYDEPLYFIIWRDPSYIYWCINNIPDFTITPEVLSQIRNLFPNFIITNEFKHHVDYLDENLSDNEEFYNDDEDYNYYDGETPTYEKYSGSYAQDEMGYSDDDIDTIFDGDPNAYWNID